MLMMILAATTAAAEAPQRAEPRCPAGVILVSKAIEPESANRDPGLIQKAKPDAKGPAVLTPECKPERRKKKDYPLA